MEVFSVARAASDHKIKCEVRKEEEGVLNPYKMLSFREIVFDVIFLIRVRKRYEIKLSMGYLHKTHSNLLTTITLSSPFNLYFLIFT